MRNEEYEDRLKILRLTTLETRRKRGDLIQFYKVLNGLDHIKKKHNPEKVVQGDKNGPAAFNLRRGEICFGREPATICTSRNEFFLNRVIPVWNESPKTVREVGTLNGFKAGLDRVDLFIT